MTEDGTGRAYGLSPIVVHYEPDALRQHTGADGCYYVNGFEVRWISGSKKASGPIRLCGSTVADYHITIQRNPADPGLEKDLRFAAEMESVGIQQRALAEQRESDALAAMALGMQMNRPAPRFQTNCMAVGNMLSCY